MSDAAAVRTFIFTAEPAQVVISSATGSGSARMASSMWSATHDRVPRA